MSKPSGKLTVELGWVIMLAGSALVVLWLSVFYPPATEQGPGRTTALEPPYAPPIRKILPVPPSEAMTVAVREVKKREGWALKEPSSVRRDGNEWLVLIGNPAVAHDYRAITVDGKDGRLLTYEKVTLEQP
jgi:hypothetical protein